jgi:hypothetical protein
MNKGTENGEIRRPKREKEQRRKGEKEKQV